jgi:hypothetical protein
MDLKNAIAVCLISLFSATLVVLIAQSLDSRAASRLEPQLARIVTELEAIRKTGGRAAAVSNAPAEIDTLDDSLIVYYFHGKTRCPTCMAIESQSHDVVQTDFASKLANGQVVWKVLNYDEPAAAKLAEQFEVMMPMVILAKMKGGRIERWKCLDDVWALVDDKPAFAKFVRAEVNQMLEAADAQSAATPSGDGPATPIPEADGGAPPDIHVPQP